MAKSSSVRKTKPSPKPSPKPASKLGKLPEWNLNDLYPGIDSPEVARDLDAADAECAGFERDFKGRLAEMAAGEDAGPRIAEAVRRYEALDDKLGRPPSQSPFPGCPD